MKIEKYHYCRAINYIRGVMNVSFPAPQRCDVSLHIDQNHEIFQTLIRYAIINGISPEYDFVREVIIRYNVEEENMRSLYKSFLIFDK